tara:strand:+ start:1340 stop:2497 length:1158 start_codon:yes stop_codon:yes gene_type:complete
MAENASVKPNATATFVELVQMEKLERLQQYAGAGMTASQMTAAANNFDKVRQEKALKVLVDQAFTGKVSELVPVIQAGNVKALRGNNGLYNSVTYLHSIGMSFRDIAAELQQREMAEINYQEALDRENNAIAEKNETQFTGDATRAMLGGDDGAFAVAIEGIGKTDRAKAAELQKEYAEAGNDRLTSDSKAIDFLDGKGIELSFGDLAKQRALLSNADQKKYLGIVNTYEDREFQDVKAIIAGEMEISVRIQDMAADNKNLARHRVFSKIIGKLQRQQMIAARKGENFDALVAGDKLLKEMFTDHKELEFKAVQSKASGLIGGVNRVQLEGTDRLLELTDYAAAQSYFESILSSIKNNTAIDRFTKDDISYVEILIDKMEEAQGQ